ncbi:alpha-ribazole phosphatase [Fusibacter paucivorans]|uniref:Alpha-ribazole phosphatase n=1 Tax=Fusibacter paucivorans TaxID=76009 RepID=A0ABS5PTD4_9FIRM|nr:alpha-ribazole phosphatase [Fusibacter paucivorans]MBS7528430.1 alpha-ribazole phosphatase [Fusibacter paucivorans]
MKTIYLLRHGKPVLPDTQRRFIGQSNLPISAEGLRQANAIGKMLNRKKIEAIYCSDLSRAYDTAQCIAMHRDIAINQHAALREINLGNWEGLTFAEVASYYPEEFKARGQDIGYFKPPNGESFMDLKARVSDIFHHILTSEHDKIAIVGHAGVNRIILCDLLKMPLTSLFKITQDYGGINVLVGSESDLRVKCLNLKVAVPKEAAASK